MLQPVRYVLKENPLIVHQLVYYVHCLFPAAPGPTLLSTLSLVYPLHKVTLLCSLSLTVFLRLFILWLSPKCPPPVRLPTSWCKMSFTSMEHHWKLSQIGDPNSSLGYGGHYVKLLGLLSVSLIVCTHRPMASRRELIRSCSTVCNSHQSHCLELTTRMD